MSAADVVVRAALVVAAINGVVGIYGSVRWYRVESSREFWIGLRVGQAAAAILGIGVGVLWVAGRRATDSLVYLYVLLPLAIGFVAEQLRVLAAEQILTARGLTSAQGVGELAEEDQQSIVVAILRREMGVMAAAALAVCFMALRAAMTARGF